MLGSIVAEGRSEELVMKHLLARHPQLRKRKIKVRLSESRYESQSKARTLLALWPEFVVLVAPTGTVDEQDVYDQRSLLDMALGQAGSPRRWYVSLFVPEVEALFFRDEQLLNTLAPTRPSREQRRRARTRPSEVLAELLGVTGEQALLKALSQRLRKVDLSPLWAQDELRFLEQFLLEISRPPRPPAAHP